MPFLWSFLKSLIVSCTIHRNFVQQFLFKTSQIIRWFSLQIKRVTIDFGMYNWISFEQLDMHIMAEQKKPNWKPGFRNYLPVLCAFQWWLEIIWKLTKKTKNKTNKTKQNKKKNFFSKEVEIFITLEVYIYVVTACSFLLATSTQFQRYHMNFSFCSHF